MKLKNTGVSKFVTLKIFSGVAVSGRLLLAGKTKKGYINELFRIWNIFTTENYLPDEEV